MKPLAPVFAGWVFFVVNLIVQLVAKEKLMHVTLVQFVLCKQQLVCGLEMDAAAF